MTLVGINEVVCLPVCLVAVQIVIYLDDDWYTKMNPLTYQPT